METDPSPDVVPVLRARQVTQVCRCGTAREETAMQAGSPGQVRRELETTRAATPVWHEAEQAAVDAALIELRTLVRRIGSHIGSAVEIPIRFHAPDLARMEGLLTGLLGGEEPVPAAKDLTRIETAIAADEAEVFGRDDDGGRIYGRRCGE